MFYIAVALKQYELNFIKHETHALAYKLKAAGS